LIANELDFVTVLIGRVGRFVALLLAILS